MKNSSKIAPIGLLLLLLAAIATLTSLQRPKVEVTVSGLTLLADRRQVLDQMGEPNFREGHPEPTHLEYWSDPVNVDPSLSIDFDENGQTIRIEGGKPEINGENVRQWSLEQVESALGPAAEASRGQALSSGEQVAEGDAFLKYPDRKLLVTWNPEAGTNFILFAGSR